MLYTITKMNFNCTTTVLKIKCCYSHILCGGSANTFKFSVILYWFGSSHEKQEILKQNYKDLFIWAEVPMIPDLIIFTPFSEGSICNTHNSLMQNRKWLNITIWFKLFMSTSTYWLIIIEKWCWNYGMCLELKHIIHGRRHI